MDKPKLNQTAKQLILQQSLQKIEEDERKSFRFLKFLLLSKQFLTVSRHNNIYILIMKTGTSQPAAFCFTRNSANYVREFYLSVESAGNMIRLLKPREFDVHFGSRGFGEYEKVIDEVLGRIGFFVKSNSCLSMVSKCMDRVVRLECSPENLLKSQQPSLNLDFLEIIPESLGQLRQILMKHRVKKLKTILYPSYVIIEDSTSNHTPEWNFESNILEELDVRFKEGPSYFLPFIYRLLAIFPSLKVFSICFDGSDIYPYDFTPRGIIDTISELYAMFQELDRKLNDYPNIKSLKFECIYRYRRPEENENWISGIKRIETFSTAKHSSEGDNDQECNTMEMKAKNAIFKFVSKPL